MDPGAGYGGGAFEFVEFGGGVAGPFGVGVRRKVFTREVMELAQRGSASTFRVGIVLSAAEEIVLRLMDTGKSTKEIALLRHTSEITVEKQRGQFL